ncbi:hypothetical protein H5410_027866 [Solanum commersonii]|uniref:Uncharacterized protein n=1 Tax=Solanum commersonii TaxID=4109 RepID=A0A9J5Z5S3_SOLCO|nr:hypothetical protein H5410_027866 [Solanum commersonii]
MDTEVSLLLGRELDGSHAGGRFTGSIAKSKEIKDIRFKFKNDPIRLGDISVKSKQSEIVEGGDKDQYDASSSKKRKGKAIVYWPLG